jgi:hypothetical protein
MQNQQCQHITLHRDPFATGKHTAGLPFFPPMLLYYVLPRRCKLLRSIFTKSVFFSLSLSPSQFSFPSFGFVKELNLLIHVVVLSSLPVHRFQILVDGKRNEHPLLSRASSAVVLWSVSPSNHSRPPFPVQITSPWTNLTRCVFKDNLGGHGSWWALQASPVPPNFSV